MTTARWPRQSNVSDVRGFSLPEALFALLLMAVSTSALLQYHRVLTLGFSQQWQQREAWRVAEQRLLGHEVPGWQSRFEKTQGPGGCVLEKAEVSGPHQRHASLMRLTC
ncbi:MULTISPECIES: prepilin-type N-terminal cleavage/methylation domain-containing protein [Pantoea]|uniref:Prepilin peptidase dependent protein C-like C-terminal domain-containing protein n=1 Tax=Pantoea ananas TaxID=553 RepID=A0AAJ1FS06_PANAN|nr:prepilin-type N-terminal cleavage/methylation domain-containing protein [Pantoea ananatis]MCK0554952.1 prepilin-type cleavage/methylation domain-containing protein [Pantoea ananatis]MCW0307264.1 hypothetical protein [Pantoea ananatis]MCW0312140.1 hypothetical protein [Pantoea ananatis]MCW0316999.1 hypothetical protein [Pantoea ananatis]MCW0331345.1 hypothetical protein [Pantoea ananatis]